MDTSIVKYSVTDAAIAEMSKNYLPMTINGLEDKVGFQMVHAARMDVKRKRLEVEKTRKELKADALRYTQAVDGEARRITSLLEPIEQHLEAQEAVITQEKARIKQAEDDRLNEMAQSRVNSMNEAGAVLSFLQARAMTDEEFQPMLVAARAELERQLAEEEAKQAERKKAEEALAEERRKLQEQRKVMEHHRLEQERLQKAEQKKLDSEREAIRLEIERLEKIRRDREHQTEIEEAAKKAAADAVAAAAQEAEAARKAEEEAKRMAEIERVRLEALRPDREKLLALANMIEGTTYPSSLETDAAKNLLKEIDKRLGTVCRWLRKEIAALGGAA